MTRQDFLLEIGTEELPPKTLEQMGKALASNLGESLNQSGLAHGTINGFASPRRLAVLVRELETQQPDQPFEKRGPAVKAAFDADGNATRAAMGFAGSCGVSVDALETVTTDKGDYLVHRGVTPGSAVAELLPAMLSDTVQKLPIAKRMRWGDHSHEFVRPVKWLVMLFGSDTVEATLFGVAAGSATRGHRIHHPDPIELNAPADYESVLETRGKVIADFEKRRSVILAGLEEAAQAQGLVADIPRELLDEVTALNEWPVVMGGSFDEAFLRVPPEALVSSMQDHQKYFPLRHEGGDLAARFLFVANLESKDPASVIEGNERVIRPRLSDAAFFWDMDKRERLADRAPNLESVVFQKTLGTLADKSARIRSVMEKIGAHSDIDVNRIKRAAELAKCDLVTDLVFEFDDLQGIAGYYYALNDCEPEEVALAIRDQYRPGHAGDDLPQNHLGKLLAVADRLDTLVGIFGIGQRPSGTRDPYALRRAALGVLRILLEGNLDLDLRELLGYALAAYEQQDVRLKHQGSPLVDEVLKYCMERLRAYYQDRGVSTDIFLSVAASQVSRPVDFDARIRAVQSFSAGRNADTLIQANKRVQNLLQSATVPSIPLPELRARLVSEHERELIDAVAQVKEKTDGGYQSLLGELSELAVPLDGFFDNVMVNVDDEELRQSRLALLQTVRGLFLEVADVSLLAH